MGFFDHLHKKGTNPIKAQPVQIRKEVLPPSKQPVRPLHRPNARDAPRPTTVQNLKRDSALLLKPRPSNKRSSPFQQRLVSDSEGSGDEALKERSSKRIRPDPSLEPDENRRVRSHKAYSDEDGGIFPMVHAADVVSLDTSIKFVPVFEASINRAEIYLQYPSASQKEKYYLVKPQYGIDDFEAVEDIIQVMHGVAKHYLPPIERAAFTNESSGYPQRLSRAVKRQSEGELRVVISEWNGKLESLRRSGTISTILDEYKSLDPSLVERILTQTYSRTVSPRVKSLREYENGTDNVYGELLPNFLSNILKKDTQMKSDQVFVDLGSGVGNVVLQAALEIGCESWGCEMMKNACDLAELQQKEFEARCRLWGLAVGKIYLERGDFLVNRAITKALHRADVVLVNNQAFTPQLNEALTSLFLDLKEGCRIVSLKSFVPAGHKISARNLNSPYNVLDVKQKQYFSGCVSWTNAPGTYYVSRKDTSRIKAHAELLQ